MITFVPPLVINRKKIQECEYLNRLCWAQLDFPHGEVFAGETPDFLIEDDFRRVGIEITEIYIDDPHRPNNLQSLDSTKNNITSLAEKFFAESGHPSLYVTLLFNIRKPMRKRELTRIASAVAQTVALNIPPEGERVEVQYRLNSIQPKEVDLIWIDRKYFWGTDLWDWREAGTPQRDAISHIQNTVDKKGTKLSACLKKCDECRLLIVAPTSMPSGMVLPDEHSLQHVYCSEFSQIYFLDAVDGSVTRLNTDARINAGK